jgi:CheY-like chemotaxis protein
VLRLQEADDVTAYVGAREVTPRGEGASATTMDPLAGAIRDDRSYLQPGDRVLLIIEDNAHFAGIILDTAHERGFKGVIAMRGAAGLELARRLQPDAITLDIRLPDMDGWKLLDDLKHDPETRHIPVHVVTVVEGQQRGLELGAIAHLTKPVSKEELIGALDKLSQQCDRKVNHLLVVEDEEAQRDGIVNLLGNDDIQITAVGTGKDALDALETQQFDCAVVDLRLPDITGFQLIEKMKDRLGDAMIPVIVYTATDLTKRQETKLRQLANTIVVKGPGAPERLLSETALFLHRVETSLPEERSSQGPGAPALAGSLATEPDGLKGRTALIVDDDMRNVFALSSVLEREGMQVIFAENGAEGIDTLMSHPEVDVVLMDIMMPDIDGYEAIRRIRKLGPYASLPIIAITAKAMKEDREKCIEAGADDYISKPVAVEHLLALLRAWLRSRESESRGF